MGKKKNTESVAVKLTAADRGFNIIINILMVLLLLILIIPLWSTLALSFRPADFIGTYIIPMITAAVGWLVGTRKRNNDFLQDLQASIDLLSSENKKLLADITSVNAEIVAVRKENEELKASVDKLCSENSQLKEEIRQLKDKIHNR